MRCLNLLNGQRALPYIHGHDRELVDALLKSESAEAAERFCEAHMSEFSATVRTVIIRRFLDGIQEERRDAQMAKLCTQFVRDVAVIR